MAKNKERFHQKYVIEKTLKHHLIEWSATALSILGAILNALQFISGFYVWTVASLLWILFAWKHKHYGLLVMSAVYIMINILGIIAWAKT